MSGTDSESSAKGWSDPATARGWTAGDALQGLLDLPRQIVAELAAGRGGGSLSLLDVGSGPGDFLGCLLDRLPDATGVWTDLSPAMEAEARHRLSRFGKRVRYAIVPLEDLEVAVPSGSVDVLVSSRVTHHLTAEGLSSFYESAARLLAPGGWLANLDHVSIGAEEALLRPVRDRIFPPNPARHEHLRPAPSLADHVLSIEQAHLEGPIVAWSAFWTVLLIAHRANPA